MENGQVTEIASLMEGEWSCYGGGKLSLEWMEKGGGSQVVSLMEGE